MADDKAAPRPFPGAIPGDDGVTFTIYTPWKKSVSLIGSFNDWDPEADPLEHLGDGLFSLTKPLDDGVHWYQFVVDGTTVCDPYAREISYPDDDFGRPPHAVVRPGKPPYEWNDGQWDRPPLHDLVIYELHVSEFTEEGTFRGVIDRMDYLRDLGVNAIELLPIDVSSPAEDWGYQPRLHFAPRPPYGSPDDLKHLVDQAHQRGLAVILDLVLSHAAPEHPLNRLYDYADSPWFGDPIGVDNDWGLPSFDHRKPATQSFCRDVQNFWLQEYHVDGFRYDYAVSIGLDDQLRGMPWLVHEARKTMGNAYLIGEYLPEDPAATNAMGLDAVWHVRFSYALKALTRHTEVMGYRFEEFERAVGAFDPWAEGYEGADRVIVYLESHDEHRLINELANAGKTGDDARHRMALAATMLLTAPGVSMLYMGQEFGEESNLDVEDRQVVDWGRLETDGGRGLFEHYQRIIRFHHDHPALQGNGYSLDAIDGEAKWLAFHRWNEQGDEIVVAANFADETRGFDCPFPSPGRWHDLIFDRDVDIDEGQGAAPLELPPLEASVFVKV